MKNNPFGLLSVGKKTNNKKRVVKNSKIVTIKNIKTNLNNSNLIDNLSLTSTYNDYESNRNDKQVISKTPNLININKNQVEIEELQKRIKHLENAGGNSEEIHNLTSVVDNLQQQSTATTDTLSSLNAKVTQQSAKFDSLESTISTNSTNISSLTQDINSCITAINEINNGAELPTPLFTIPGHSFATPVYSTYDNFDYEHYLLYKNAGNNRSIWLIAEPYCPLHFKIWFKLEVPTQIAERKLIITINGNIVKSVTYSNTTAGEYEIETEFNYYSATKSLELKIYIDSTYTENHLHSIYQVWGKNVLFLNSKRKINIAPSIDDTYIFSRTHNNYPQIQIATYDNLDFENGWQYIDNYENYKGSNHIIFKSYLWDENIQQYTYLNDYLICTFCDNRYTTYFMENYTRDIMTRRTNYLITNATMFLSSINESKLTIAYGVGRAGDLESVHSYRPDLQMHYTWFNNVYHNYDLDTPTFIVDSIPVADLQQPFQHILNHIMILIDNNGFMYLYTFNAKNIIKHIGFGTQPFAYFDINDKSIFYLFANCYGIIMKYTFQYKNKSFEKLSEMIFDYGDYVVTNGSQKYFLQLNDKIIKK